MHSQTQLWGILKYFERRFPVHLAPSNTCPFFPHVSLMTLIKIVRFFNEVFCDSHIAVHAGKKCSNRKDKKFSILYRSLNPKIFQTISTFLITSNR